MRKIGIVGADGTKITDDQHRIIASKINDIIKLETENFTKTISIVSGGSPKFGTDSIAELFADLYKIEKTIFSPEPEHYHWYCGEGCFGYKPRNIMIAAVSTIVYNFAIKDDNDSCVHCQSKGHKKNGGCWTMKKAKDYGKETHLILI